MARKISLAFHCQCTKQNSLDEHPEVSESPWSPEGFPFPLSGFAGGNASSQSSTATPSPLWISAQSFSSLEYFHFPHKAPHVIMVMFGRLLPFHPSKCSTYSIFTPEPLSTWAVSLETRELYCQKNRNAKASCKMDAGTCKEQTKGTQNVLCKHFSFKEGGRYFIYHPKEARKKILEKFCARGMDLWHCRGSW